MNLPMEIKDSKIWQYILANRWQKRKFFRIPDYQRPYVWDEERIEDFWKDLTEGDINLPFLWSFIFKEDDDQIFDIVDGQQRILSIAILLAALRTIAKEIGHSNLTNSIQQRIAETDNLGNSKDFFIHCWEDVDSFFREYILSGDKNIKEIWEKITKKDTSKYNIKNNYLHIYSLIKSTIKEEGIEWDAVEIAKFIDMILNKIDDYSIVYIKVSSDEQAYTAFEIVNARGQELGNIDLLKNLFFKEAAKDQNKKAIVERRETMVNNIQNCSGVKVNLESFLKHFWHARWGKSKLASSKRLFYLFKQEILSQKNRYDSLSSEMLEDSEKYKNFTDPDGKVFLYEDSPKTYQYNLEIQNSLKNIASFSITQAYILFLTILRYQKEIGNRKVRDIFRCIESFHFAYSAIAKEQGNKLEKIYWKYAEEFINAIENSNSLEDRGNKINLVYQELKKYLQNLYPSQEVFREKFINLEYKSINKDLLRYVLTQYELFLNGWTGEKKPDFTNTNIEHIYPQKNEDKDNILDEKTVNNIGNLTLLSIKLNSSSSNNTFVEKMEHYQKSEYQMVRNIVKDFNDWNRIRNKETISERAKKMADDLYTAIKKVVE